MRFIIKADYLNSWRWLVMIAITFGFVGCADVYNGATGSLSVSSKDFKSTAEALAFISSLKEAPVFESESVDFERPKLYVVDYSINGSYMSSHIEAEIPYTIKAAGKCTYRISYYYAGKHAGLEPALEWKGELISAPDKHAFEQSFYLAALAIFVGILGLILLGSRSLRMTAGAAIVLLLGSAVIWGTLALIEWFSTEGYRKF